MLERHRPRRLRERHPVLGAVVGHITDLEAIIGQWVNRSTRPLDATPSQINSVGREPRQSRQRRATFTRTMQLRVQPSPGQCSLHPDRTTIDFFCLVQLKIATDAPRLLGFAI